MAVHSLRLYRIVSVFGTILLLGTGLFQAACGGVKKVEGKGADVAQAADAALFTVPQDQLPHLRIVPVRRTSWAVSVHTTGTVDWDADHTTQAITQVNGPISRILVDTGSRVAAGDPLLYVSSPDVANAISAYRKARNREVLDQARHGSPEGAAGPRRDCGQGLREQPGGLQRFHHRRPDQPSGAQDLRHHRAGDRSGRTARHGHPHGAGGALADCRRGGAEAGLSRHVDSGRRHRLFHDQRRFHGLGARSYLRPRPAHRAGGRRGRGNQPVLRREFPGHGGVYRIVRRPGHAHHSGPHRDPESQRAVEEGHVCGRRDPHQQPEQHYGGSGFRRVARRQERAHGLRPGGTGQVRAAAGNHRDRSRMAWWRSWAGSRTATTWCPMAACSFSSRAVSNKAETE